MKREMLGCKSHFFIKTLSHTREKKSRDSEGERLLRSPIDHFQALVKFLKENGSSYVQMHGREMLQVN